MTSRSMKSAGAAKSKGPMKKTFNNEKTAITKKPATMRTCKAVGKKVILCTHCKKTKDEYYLMFAHKVHLCYQCWSEDERIHEADMQWDGLKCFGQIHDKHGNAVGGPPESIQAESEGSDID